jgi:peptidoglycan DL-endopeptidase CwlO
MGSIKFVAAVCLAGLLVALIGFLVLAASIGASNSAAGSVAGSECTTAGALPGLDAGAAANARTVAATASARGGQRAALIAVTTGLTESGMRVLSNPNDPAGNQYPSQGVGYDHDSLGIFQQRPSWGTAAQRMDPVTSTGLFLDRLLSLTGWRSLPPWDAAQAVQVSAFADGSNYRSHLDEARRIVAVITNDAAMLDCGGSGVGSPPKGPRDATGLPASYTIPPASSRAASAVSFALTQLGKPYVWGAEGPSAYDCSGLMQAAWHSGGVQLTRTTYTQVHDGHATTEAKLSPGDLVFTPGADGTLAAPGHVGMFIGHGLVVQAPGTGDVVKVVTYASFVSDGLSELRHIG